MENYNESYVIQEGIFDGIKKRREERKQKKNEKNRAKFDKKLEKFEQKAGMTLPQEFKNKIADNHKFTPPEKIAAIANRFDYSSALSGYSRMFDEMLQQNETLGRHEGVPKSLFPVGFFYAISSISNALGATGSFDEFSFEDIDVQNLTWAGVFMDSEGKIYSPLGDAKHNKFDKIYEDIDEFCKEVKDFRVVPDIITFDTDYIVETQRPDGSTTHKRYTATVKIDATEGGLPIRSYCVISKWLTGCISLFDLVDTARLNEWARPRFNANFLSVFKINEIKFVQPKVVGSYEIEFACSFLFNNTNIVSFRIINGKLTGISTGDYFDRGLKETDKIESLKKDAVSAKFKPHKLEGKALKDIAQNDIVEEVCNVIDHSDSLITALESVASMYCIPPSYIRADNSLKNIKVVDEYIYAPDIKNASGNKEAIIRGISALLDRKGACIDHKIDDFHAKCINDGKSSLKTIDADPNKGEVIGRYVDDENNEILVYNTGVVDFTKCPSSLAKVNELRSSGMVPELNLSLANKRSYFADMDDITSDVNMSVDTSSNVTATDNVSAALTEYTVDIAREIDERRELVELCSIFEFSHNLGYELMTQQGFENLKPSNESEPTMLLTESAKDNDEMAINPEDMKWLKFDNTHIMNAVKKINEWVEESGETNPEKIDYKKLFRSPDFKEAVDELCQQFDAKIRVRFNPDGMNVYTTFTETQAMMLKKVKLSKTKGFQFSGNPINIYIVGAKTILRISLGKDVSLIGQTIVSILLHEIFHNAMFQWKVYDSEFNATLALTLQLAASVSSAKKKRQIISNYVNMLDSFCGIKMNVVTRRGIAKALITAASVNEEAMKKAATVKKGLFGKKKAQGQELTPDKDVAALIDAYTDYIKQTEKTYNVKRNVIGLAIKSALALGGLATAEILTTKKGVANDSLLVTGVLLLSGISGIGSLKSLGNTFYGLLINAARKSYESSKDLEEQWCDLFAAMYKLPVTFKINGVNKSYTDNDLSNDIVEKYVKFDINLGKFILDCHPSGAERNWQAVKVANELLKQEYLDEDVKKYLEWIVDAYKQTGDADIPSLYNTTVFDPKTAENLDEHIQHLIDISNVPLTEFTAYDLCDWGINLSE